MQDLKIKLLQKEKDSSNNLKTIEELKLQVNKMFDENTTLIDSKNKLRNQLDESNILVNSKDREIDDIKVKLRDK